MPIPHGMRRSICALGYKHGTPDGVRRCIGPSAINIALLTECCRVGLYSYKHGTPGGVQRCIGPSAINMALLTECGAALLAHSTFAALRADSVTTEFCSGLKSHAVSIRLFGDVPSFRSNGIISLPSLL